MKTEIFKDIPGYEGMYQVSNFGNVKFLPRKSNNFKCGLLQPFTNNSGYLIVDLKKDGKRKKITVHQLVAIVFLNHTIGDRRIVVNHKDFIRKNNFATNLEIITNRENTNQKHLKSASKYVGVSWHKTNKKWQAAIRINGKKKHLGYFTHDRDAWKAYKKELVKLQNVRIKAKRLIAKHAA